MSSKYGTTRYIITRTTPKTDEHISETSESFFINLWPPTKTAAL